MARVIFLLFLELLIQVSSERSFTVDLDNNCFLKDGEPFRYISGSMHYFRVPQTHWADRMAKIRAAGLNAIQTYIEWNRHEPEPGVFDFTGNNDLISFLRSAWDHQLLVILRPGPYIDAERDLGGLPYWLLRKNPNMKLRTSDPEFLTYVDRWFAVLLPLLHPLLYSNGGPIITVQVENEYGSYPACDFAYTAHLRDLYRHHLGDDVVLFSTDGTGNSYLMCGKVDGVLSTIDFSSGTNVTDAAGIVRLHQSRGPLVNSEYYSGWLDHWGEPHSEVSEDVVCKTLDAILAANFSVNIYMFHGGTSFGFSSGANLGNVYQACPTSYDYDAPLSEAGDPTDKYYAIMKVISKYTPLPPGPVPGPSPKMRVEPIPMRKVASIWNLLQFSLPVYSQYPLSFEDVKQAYGFVMYETTVLFIPTDPAVLAISGLRDRGYVFVDEKFQGVLSREQNIYSLPIQLQKRQKLQILVENQGRVCFGSGLIDRKGIVKNVTLGSRTLTNWTITPVNLTSALINRLTEAEQLPEVDETPEINGPTLYVGRFALPSVPSLDTFLKMDGWHKGVAFLNGFNLGRYWPTVGPQLTLYAPSALFNIPPRSNTIALLELQHSPCSLHSGCTVEFVRNPEINGTTPLEKDIVSHHPWTKKKYPTRNVGLTV